MSMAGVVRLVLNLTPSQQQQQQQQPQPQQRREKKQLVLGVFNPEVEANTLKIVTKILDMGYFV
jgi:hypothetical protein